MTSTTLFAQVLSTMGVKQEIDQQILSSKSIFY